MDVRVGGADANSRPIFYNYIILEERAVMAGEEKRGKKGASEKTAKKSVRRTNYDYFSFFARFSNSFFKRAISCP
jgi:hypothetical protein